MPINTTLDGGVRLQRPNMTTNGVVSDTDEMVKDHLDELNTLLGKRIFPKGDEAAKGGDDVEKKKRETKEDLPWVDALVGLELVAKHADDGWRDGSLAHQLHGQPENAALFTLGEYIDRVPALSDLKYGYENTLKGNWALYDPNFKIALNEYPAIRDYLVVVAVKRMGKQDLNGLKNFIVNNPKGVKAILDYAAVSAARTYIFNQKLAVDRYNQDDTPFVARIKAANLPLNAAAFAKSLKKVINAFVFDGEEAGVLAGAHIGDIPEELKPQLIQMMKNSKVKITAANVDFFLPPFLMQLTGAPSSADATPDGTAEPDDQDFEVEPFQETVDAVQVSRSAVRCAAQLFYGMVLGDELDVFSTVNYFTHNYLLRGGIEIQDGQLREDLQLYVFSNRFLDLKTRKILDRTRPAERQMFYKQVFNAGADLKADSDLSQVLVPNQEFPRLWKVLILETAKYIERAQAAFYPDTFVSRQNIQQAVEDLQYNLSTHAIGMVNVVSPLIYSELNFVIRRIFMHEEVMRQLVPAGATWWRVVETLYLAMRNERPRATVLYNKAKLGHDILSNVADYDTAMFQDNEKFFAFISAVEAFITTQSILQQDEGPTGGSEAEPDEEDAPAAPGPRRVLRPSNMPSATPVAAGAANANGGNGSGSGSGGGEWDF